MRRFGIYVLAEGRRPLQHFRQELTQGVTMSQKPVFKKVLVANDKLEGLDLALPKAAMIEHYSGAAIEVVEVLYDTIAEEPERILPAAEQANLIEGLKAAERNGLRRLIEPLEGKVADIGTRVIWEKKRSRGHPQRPDGRRLSDQAHLPAPGPDRPATCTAGLGADPHRTLSGIDLEEGMDRTECGAGGSGCRR